MAQRNRQPKAPTPAPEPTPDPLADLREMEAESGPLPELPPSAYPDEATPLPEQDPSLEEKVFTALGAASMCWDNTEGAGVFQGEEAKAIGDDLVSWLRRRTTSPETRPMVSQELWDEMVAETVAAWHADPTSQGFLHGGGQCGCFFIARTGLRAAVPVAILDETEETVTLVSSGE